MSRSELDCCDFSDPSVRLKPHDLHLLNSLHRQSTMPAGKVQKQIRKEAHHRAGERRCWTTCLRQFLCAGLSNAEQEEDPQHLTTYASLNPHNFLLRCLLLTMAHMVRDRDP